MLQPASAVAPQLVVLDTNIVLDLWLYQDPATPALLQALLQNTVCWLATPVMRDELERVLAYAHIAKRLALGGLTAEHVLTQFDTHAKLVAVAPKAPFVCKDPDDQQFIDLAAQHQAALVSKDKAVLTMRNRMARLGVSVGKIYPLSAVAATATK
ncbi:MAG: tRNA(fMet)-specific endonuclease VapC [Pseudomonadota bacterium]